MIIIGSLPVFCLESETWFNDDNDYRDFLDDDDGFDYHDNDDDNDDGNDKQVNWGLKLFVTMLFEVDLFPDDPSEEGDESVDCDSVVGLV